MSGEKQFCRNCGKRDLAFSQEDTVRFWEPGLCMECHRLPVIGTRYDVFTGERIQPTPRHDGNLVDHPHDRLCVELIEQGVSLYYPGNDFNRAKTRYITIAPKIALSLLAWLTQEREKLEALAKEQAEPDETNIDFAEHLPPADWKPAKEQTE